MKLEEAAVFNINRIPVIKNKFTIVQHGAVGISNRNSKCWMPHMQSVSLGSDCGGTKDETEARQAACVCDPTVQRNERSKINNVRIILLCLKIAKQTCPNKLICNTQIYLTCSQHHLFCNHINKAKQILSKKYLTFGFS